MLPQDGSQFCCSASFSTELGLSMLQFEQGVMSYLKFLWKVKRESDLRIIKIIPSEKGFWMALQG